MLDEELLPPSKSAVKREMIALQKIGEQLVALSDRELKRIPIADEDLVEAIHAARRIRSNSARRRQLQFIGKLMRKIDAEPLANALEALHMQSRQENEEFHNLELLRDSLLNDGHAALETYIQDNPQADRQHIRQLLMQHHKEVLRHQPLAASKKLFQYLRDLQEN